MFTQSLEQSPKNRRGGGQTSHLLLAPVQLGSRNLAITWVEGAPGSQQSLHAHPDSEQVYVIVAGRGLMIVDGEEQDVGAGTMVLIPPGSQHAIHNRGPKGSSTPQPPRRPSRCPPASSPIRPPTAQPEYRLRCGWRWSPTSTET
jgi:mannose-6-phosphate isomerase-like protein (cupin superfamily)